MPEGDTIAYAASRLRPVLEGFVPDAIRMPQPRHRLDRWPERLSGRRVVSVDTHGKHLFLHFEGDLVVHSHLGMNGVWGVYPRRAGQPPAGHPGSPDWAGPASSGWGRSASRAWLILSRGGFDAVQFDGPTLELMTEARRRFDQRLAALGPDVLAEQFDRVAFLRRLRSDDPTRSIGDALLDQRNVAGIGNIWKAEGCWEAGVDPWRGISEVSDAEAVAVIEAMRPRMARSASAGPRAIQSRVYGRARRPCPRCGTAIAAQTRGSARSSSGLTQAGPAPRPPAGDANRTTYWCPGCQR